MGTTARVSVPALRILTYTILIKAVIGAVVLMCIAAAGGGLFSADSVVSAAGSVFVTARTAEFINIVACVMCLGGMTALSGRFTATLRIMVAALVIECFVLLPVTAGLYLTITNDAAAVSAANVITLTLSAAERLLTGTAFLFLMKGFGECLREDGDSSSAAASEKLGVIYLCSSIAFAAVVILMNFRTDGLLQAAYLILSLAGVILEVLMYIRAHDAAFRIWRKRAFSEQA